YLRIQDGKLYLYDGGSLQPSVHPAPVESGPYECGTYGDGLVIAGGESQAVAGLPGGKGIINPRRWGRLRGFALFAGMPPIFLVERDDGKRKGPTMLDLETGSVTPAGEDTEHVVQRAGHTWFIHGADGLRSFDGETGHFSSKRLDHDRFPPNRVRGDRIWVFD